MCNKPFLRGPNKCVIKLSEGPNECVIKLF